VIGRGPWTDGEPHRCPVPRCPETVHRFMCRSHWAALPKAVHDDVWRAVAVESALLMARLVDRASDRTLD
jgi:hypothetical protein